MPRSKVDITYKGGDYTERLHRKGAELAPDAWYALNLALADNMRVYCNIAEPAMKELLARAALVAVVSLQEAGHLLKEAPACHGQPAFTTK